ncbi:MAG: helix-turn-helix domain-containing protein [Vulcanimicrobiaceae bacterium]
MEQATLERNAERPLEISLRATSDDRFWNGLSARVFDVYDGTSKEGPEPEHYLAMLAGPPIPSSCRCDELHSQRLQLPGELDIVPAGAFTCWRDGGSSTFVDVTLSSGLLRTAAEGMGVAPERVSLEPQLCVRDPQLEHVFWALKAELESEAPFGRLYADSLGLALAAHLLRRYAARAPRRLAAGLSKRRLTRVLDYISDNIAHDLSLAELASVAELSPSHFKTLFRQSLGLPVHQYVIRRRVEFAAKLLLRRRAICEVALLAGFANQSHLSRCMRRVLGTTPRALLRELS